MMDLNISNDSGSFLSGGSSSLSRDMQFGIVRDVMYKYSKLAQERFMSDLDLAFLFIWFQQQPHAVAFVIGKID